MGVAKSFVDLGVVWQTAFTESLDGAVHAELIIERINV